MSKKYLPRKVYKKYSKVNQVFLSLLIKYWTHFSMNGGEYMCKELWVIVVKWQGLWRKCEQKDDDCTEGHRFCTITFVKLTRNIIQVE